MSLIFYAWWNPIYILLLVGPTALDYVAGQKIFDSPVLKTKRLWLAAALTSNLGILAFFKYGGFILDNAVWTARLLGFSAHSPQLNWVIPLGISFYTFQVMSYTLDIYRGKLAPARSFVNFLQFICFFPHLVAGPIVRARELLPQFDRRRRLSPAAIQGGIYFIIWGLFMKMVVADGVAFQVDSVFSVGDVHRFNWVKIWLTVILFSGQIFADFAGYSSIAIGLAMLMGVKFPRNFNYPYISSSFSEFWSRWHITLSHWLRDYLYVPLGGNRLGTSRTYLNLMVTMILGGLWHGASCTFVAWGAMQGAALSAERMIRGRSQLAPHHFGTEGAIGAFAASRRLFFMAIVFVFLLVTWVFFRSPTFSLAIAVLNKMFVSPFREQFIWPSDMNPYLFLLLPIIVLHMGQLAREWFGLRTSGYIRATAAAAMVLGLVVIQRPGRLDFIYFQF
jgi:alginate O-acetyltransferase complex protein AlgI